MNIMSFIKITMYLVLPINCEDSLSASGTKKLEEVLFRRLLSNPGMVLGHGWELHHHLLFSLLPSSDLTSAPEMHIIWEVNPGPLEKPQVLK